MTVTGQQIVATAMQWNGLPYRLGAEVRGADQPTALDCSELVELACRRNGVAAPDGTVHQFPWRIPCSIPEAISTPGALLFIWKGPHAGNGGGNHVAISRGDGTTIEARSTKYGVGVFPAGGRGWTHGGLIPGVHYPHRDMEGQSMAAMTPEERSDFFEAFLNHPIQVREYDASGNFRHVPATIRGALEWSHAEAVEAKLAARGAAAYGNTAAMVAGQASEAAASAEAAARSVAAHLTNGGNLNVGLITAEMLADALESIAAALRGSK